MQGDRAEQRSNPEEGQSALNHCCTPHPTVRDQQNDAGEGHRAEGDEKNPFAGDRVTPAEQKESEDGSERKKKVIEALVEHYWLHHIRVGLGLETESAPDLWRGPQHTFEGENHYVDERSDDCERDREHLQGCDHER